jgi:hypothetical protein
MGTPLDRLATDVHVLSEISRVCEGDPLTIEFLVKALKKADISPERLSRMPPGLEAHVKDWLAELRRGTQATSVYELLALCAAALSSLTSADLQALAPDTFARLVVLQEAAAHLVQAEHWQLARAVLTNTIPVGTRHEQPWAAARYDAEDSYTGYLADLDSLRTYAEQQHDLALGLHCVLISTSIRRLSGNFSPELLVALVTVGTPKGKWSPAAVLETALEIARALDGAQAETWRTETLEALALQLVRISNTRSAQISSLWHTTIRTLAARGRPSFLRDLAALTPWLAALASPEELTEIAIAIRDVCRCWP